MTSMGGCSFPDVSRWTIVTVGRGLESGTIELRDRATDEREEVPVTEAAARVLAAVRPA